jgi:hypothetical protein
MSTEEKTKPRTDLFDQAVKNYEVALKAGLKLQEDSLRMWTGLLNQTAAPQDAHKRAKTLVEDIIPQTQKTIEDNLKLMEQSSRTTLDLLKKAAAAAQATTMQDAQSKFLNLYEASLNAVRDTTVAFTQANAKAVDSWGGYLRKTAEPVPMTKP